MTDTTFCSSRSICVRSIVKAAVRSVSRAHGRRRHWPQKTNDYTEREREKKPLSAFALHLPQGWNPPARTSSHPLTHAAPLRGNCREPPHQKVKTVQVEGCRLFFEQIDERLQLMVLFLSVSGGIHMNWCHGGSFRTKVVFFLPGKTDFRQLLVEFFCRRWRNAIYT